MVVMVVGVVGAGKVEIDTRPALTNVRVKVKAELGDICRQRKQNLK